VESILQETKKVVGMAEDYTAFDVDMILFINAALSTAEQVGAGLTTVTSIQDAATEWDDLGLDLNNLSMLKNYVYLKAKLMFDPPATSFAIEAMERQIEGLEYRMRTNTELKAANQ
jgi:hypothetical protein